ncbi:MAG: CHAT domain-containing protein [Nitrospirae bacterium]|nr:CHAT domain-containing protein [Nitrospirota bacterium]
MRNVSVRKIAFLLLFPLFVIGLAGTAFAQSEDEAVKLYQQGQEAQKYGRYQEALSYFEKSLEINKKLGHLQGISANLNYIGAVYDSLGQYEKALTYYEESLKISKELKIPQSVAGSLNNIGGVYLYEKRYKEAEQKFLQTKGEPGLVAVFLATGRHNEALKLLKNMPPEWNSDNPYRIQFYTQYGFALKGVGQLKESSSKFYKAVSIAEEMRQKVKGEKTGFLGGGYLGGRIRAYKGLVASLSERAINGETKDKEFISFGKDFPSNAFYFAESTKARTLLEAMVESARKSQKVEISEDLRQREQSLINQLTAIENLWDDAYKKGEEVLKRLQERKEGLTVELNTLIKELRQKYPRYAALNYPKPIPAEELPLKDNEVLIEYAIGDDASYVFVVKKGGVKNLFKIPIGKEALEEKVKSFMEPMNTKNYEGFSVKEAKGLYDLLLADALKEVHPSPTPLPQGEGANVIIVPDGILGLLPFEALIVKEGKDYKDSLYAGDKYNISYYQSATVLALQRGLKENKPEKMLFALGNPIYSTDDLRYIAWKEKKENVLIASLNNKYSFRGLAIKPKWGKTTEADAGSKIEFPPLPETEIEVKEIAKIMNVKTQPPDVLLSMTANETELRKTGLEKYKYVHFATHASLPGMIQGINEPFLLLGQVENNEKDDGFLTINEVLDLRLNADAVVLSACVTGVGKEVEGEGVANFARAFQHAGARSIVVSLWEVASDPAVEYMKAFYGHLKAGKSRGEALRLARNE